MDELIICINTFWSFFEIKKDYTFLLLMCELGKLLKHIKTN